MGDVVLVARPPIHTGQPTSLQPKFRGPLVVSEVLPNDAYRLIQLEGSGKRKYTVTAHCSQMRWYRVHGEETDVLPLDFNSIQFFQFKTWFIQELRLLQRLSSRKKNKKKVDK